MRRPRAFASRSSRSYCGASRFIIATPPRSTPEKISALASAIASIEPRFFDVNRRDRGDQRDLRLDEADERRDLARVVHADLEHGEFGVARQSGERERHTPMIVVGRGRGVRRPDFDSASRSISLAVVLPTEPVTAAMRRLRARAAWPKRSIARKRVLDLVHGAGCASVYGHAAQPRPPPRAGFERARDCDGARRYVALDCNEKIARRKRARCRWRRRSRRAVVRRRAE